MNSALIRFSFSLFLSSSCSLLFPRPGILQFGLSLSHYGFGGQQMLMALSLDFRIANAFLTRGTKGRTASTTIMTMMQDGMTANLEGQKKNKKKSLNSLVSGFSWVSPWVCVVQAFYLEVFGLPTFGRTRGPDMPFLGMCNFMGTKLVAKKKQKFF